MWVEKLFKTIDFDQVNDFEVLRKEGASGFAALYLERCDEETKEADEIDIELYARLVELDAKVETSSSEQLFECLLFTSRWEIIKVNIIFD